jgi:hypothetical protein
MGLVPLKFIHTITSRKSAELVIAIVDVAATSCLGHLFTPFTALGVNTNSNLSAFEVGALSAQSKRRPARHNLRRQFQILDANLVFASPDVFTTIEIRHSASGRQSSSHRFSCARRVAAQLAKLREVVRHSGADAKR